MNPDVLPLFVAFDWKTIIPILAFPAILLAIIFINVTLARRRANAWKAEAERIGFTHQKEDRETRNEIIRLPSFSSGRERKFTNVIKGTSATTEIVLGEYSQSTTTRRKSASGGKRRQTLCVVIDSELNSPHFFLRRQTAILDRISQAQDVPIHDDPEFSNAFVVRGDDPDAVIAFLTPELRSFFLSYKDANWHIEGLGRIVVVHNEKYIKPSNTRDLMEVANNVVQSIKRLQ